MEVPEGQEDSVLVGIIESTVKYNPSLETVLQFLWGIHTPPPSLGIPYTVPSFGLKSIC